MGTENPLPNDWIIIPTRLQSEISGHVKGINGRYLLPNFSANTLGRRAILQKCGEEDNEEKEIVHAQNPFCQFICMGKVR